VIQPLALDLCVIGAGAGGLADGNAGGGRSEAAQGAAPSFCAAARFAPRARRRVRLPALFR
jgi:hypothetical protein